MLNLMKRFVRPTDAQDLIEYALIGALLSCCAVAGIRGVGGNVSGIFDAGVAMVDAGPGSTPVSGGGPGSGSGGSGVGSGGGNTGGSGGGNSGGNGGGGRK